MKLPSERIIAITEAANATINPINKEWGIGRVQSIINGKVTVNFQNVGKKVINAKIIELKKIYNE